MTFPLSRLLVAALLCLALSLPAGPGRASEADFLATLSPAQQQEFKAWRAAKAHYERRLDAYWHDVEKKRKERRPKRGSGKLYLPDDYVWTFPPEYKGPGSSADLARRWSRYQAAQEEGAA